jgi:hypothetical protein
VCYIVVEFKKERISVVFPDFSCVFTPKLRLLCVSKTGSFEFASHQMNQTGSPSFNTQPARPKTVKEFDNFVIDALLSEYEQEEKREYEQDEDTAIEHGGLLAPVIHATHSLTYASTDEEEEEKDVKLCRVDTEGVELVVDDIESVESVDQDSIKQHQQFVGLITPLDSLGPYPLEDEGLGKSPLIIDWDLEVDAVT